MGISSNLLEIREYTDEGYKPVIDYDKWRVAVLNYCDELLPENINHFQKHDETDEVFVLLKGRCILFVGEGKEEVTEIYAEDLEPLKLYNVKRSIWHTHTLSKDAMVLIVENKDTTADNSPLLTLTNGQKEKLIDLTRKLWDDQINDK